MSGSSSLVITPTQMARVNGQRNKRWSSVSRLVPQRGHMMWVWSPRRSLWSAVQQHRRSASQAWSLNFRGMKECHTFVAPGRDVVPVSCCVVNDQPVGNLKRKVWWV
jgi:hypothetical protein